MGIQVEVQLNNELERERIEVADGTIATKIVKQFQPHMPYRILAVRMDNASIPMNTALHKDCKLQLLDMRDPSANQIYQRSVSFLYLKAVYDVLGTRSVFIENSLNKGLYTEVKVKSIVTEVELKKIDGRMRELVAADLPLERTVETRRSAIQKLQRLGYVQKLRLLNSKPSLDRVPFYHLDGLENFFYGSMVPSTGYIEYFELRRCRRGILLRFPESGKPNVIPAYRDDVKLYHAFGEAKQWADLMEINFVADLNEKVRDGSYKEVIQISEALHAKKIVEIADEITKQQKHMILIAGPSSSGKTTFAHRLCIQLRVNGLKPLYMGTDDYFVDRENAPLDEKGEYNFEDLEAVDVRLFNAHMNALLRGEEVNLPTFDFIMGKKIFGKRMTRLAEGQPIVMEGIHGLNRLLTVGIADEEKYKIYISPLTQLNIDAQNRVPTTDDRLLRRIVRDYQFRGYSAARTIAMWPKVRAGEDKNIFPFNGEADVLFNSEHIYEVAVLKKYAQPLLEGVTQEQPEYSEATRMLRFLQFVEEIEDDSMIVNNSIIREFIGGSIFVE